MESPCIPWPYIHIAPIITLPHHRVYLVSLINLHWHILPKAHSFTLGFVLGGIPSVGFNKNIMTCILHYSITQSSFTALKTLCALPGGFNFDQQIPRHQGWLHWPTAGHPRGHLPGHEVNHQWGSAWFWHDWLNADPATLLPPLLPWWLYHGERSWSRI